MISNKQLNAAWRIHQSKDIQLPPLSWWNDKPCKDHEEITEGCQKCGIILRKHQRVGAAWLYMRKKGLLADTVGSGKSFQAAALLALMKERGERTRVLVITRPAPIYQFASELQRAVPKLNVAIAQGTRQKRFEQYVGHWDVLLIGPQMLLNDELALQRLGITTVIIDDTDVIRHPNTRQAQAIKNLIYMPQIERVVVMTATPLQKKLMELYYILILLGGKDIFGTASAFKRTYITINNGHKNLPEFKRKLAPFVLRRTATDIDDVKLPIVVPSNIFLDLTPSQRTRYKELQAGILSLMKEGNLETKHVEAVARFTYGAQICSGLVTLGELYRSGQNCKLDKVTEMLTGDLSEEKAVVFMRFKKSIRFAQEMLEKNGIGYVTIWGEDSNKKRRYEAQQRFWYDDNCKVLLGTQAIEQSLNLQISAHLINVDTIPNPARMEQLAGRIRRDGSPHTHVYVHNLLTTDTQEERMIAALQREQTLINFVWDEESELFERINSQTMLKWITGT